MSNILSDEAVAKIAKEASNEPTQEQNLLEEQIKIWLPKDLRDAFVGSLHFALQVAYLRGQRDAYLSLCEPK
jgi:hypothetical protein